MSIVAAMRAKPSRDPSHQDMNSTSSSGAVNSAGDNSNYVGPRVNALHLDRSLDYFLYVNHRRQTRCPIGSRPRRELFCSPSLANKLEGDRLSRVYIGVVLV